MPNEKTPPWGKCHVCKTNIRVRNARYYCPKCDKDLGSTDQQQTPSVKWDVTVLAAKNLFATQQLLSKGYIRYTDFDDVLKVIDEAHNEQK